MTNTNEVVVYEVTLTRAYDSGMFKRGDVLGTTVSCGDCLDRGAKRRGFEAGLKWNIEQSKRKPCKIGTLCQECGATCNSQPNL